MRVNDVVGNICQALAYGKLAAMYRRSTPAGDAGLPKLFHTPKVLLTKKSSNQEDEDDDADADDDEEGDGAEADEVAAAVAAAGGVAKELAVAKEKVGRSICCPPVVRAKAWCPLIHTEATLSVFLCLSLSFSTACRIIHRML